MGLEQDIEKQLGVPISSILRQHRFPTTGYPMSITNIFDAETFGHVLYAFIPTGVAGDVKQIATYGQAWQLLKEVANLLAIELPSQEQPSTQFLARHKIDYEEEVIESATWSDLRTLCKVLFHIMLKNESVLYEITKMEEKYQLQIKEYIESSQEFNEAKVEMDSPTTMNRSFGSFGKGLGSAAGEQLLLDKIDELEHGILNRDQELAKAREKLAESKEELTMLKSVLQEKEAEIGMLKKRIEAYSQADVLFEQKDQQIAKLNSQLSQLKVKAHIKSTEQHTELVKLKQRCSELQTQKCELAATNEELANKNELLTINKEESESTNKKVIANLKEKIKTLNDRIADQQKNLMDVLIEKEQRDKELFELGKKTSLADSVKKSKIALKNEDIRSSSRKSSKLMDELGDISNLLEESNHNFKYFEVLFGDMQDRCTGEMCIALRSEYVRVVQQILEMNADTDSLIYITPANRLECILKQLQKIHEGLQENLKLKEKLILLQAETGKGQSSKQSMEQINKLKKKILVLKRNIDEVETRRKEEIEVLVAAMSQSGLLGSRD